MKIIRNLDASDDRKLTNLLELEPDLLLVVKHHKEQALRQLIHRRVAMVTVFIVSIGLVLLNWRTILNFVGGV